MNKSIKQIIPIGIIVCAIVITTACGKNIDVRNKTAIPLSGQWKISFSDNMDNAAPRYDDSSWDSITLPGSFIQYSRDKTGSSQGTAWLRRKITVPSGTADGPLGLTMGRISNADEVYFNGILIGSTGDFPPHENAMWNYPRYYLVPQSLILKGKENVIAVRVSYSGFADILGKLQILDYETWRFDKKLKYFTHVISGYAIIAMGNIFSLIFLLFFIRYREKEYLYYVLQQPAGFIIVLELCSFFSIFNSVYASHKILSLSWALLNVFHPLFLHSIYDLKRPLAEKILWIYLGLVILIRFFLPLPGPEYYKVLIISNMTMLIGIYNISCHVSALVKKHPYAKLFSFFGIISIIGAIHDGLTYTSKFTGKIISIGGYEFTSMIFHFTSAFFLTGTALVLVVRYINIMQEVEDLNTSLEGFVIENALLHKKIDESESTQVSRLAITEQAEEKIKKVIIYINENYSSDLSREGLAASIDIHPDNLGKLFKTYTGKKLGDYIYDLRLNEASRKLLESNDTIIDIAFTSGFESLRTFNRVFLKFKGMTPDKYRKTYQIKPAVHA